MPKKNYKRKSSKALTKQRKLLKDPDFQKTEDSINTSSRVWDRKKNRN